MEKVALDRGYDTGAVHRGLELLGITGYIPAIRFPNDPSKYGFSYDPQQDIFICPMGQPLVYHRLNCNKSTGKYLRCYQVQGDVCRKCTSRKTCFDTAGVRRRILASSCYPAFYRGHLRVNTPEYLYMMRKRKIWAEGSFAVMKREHNLLKIRKRGILPATEECLLSAMALNLKRMVKAIFSAMLMDKIWAENMFSQPIFCLCQQVQLWTVPFYSSAVWILYFTLPHHRCQQALAERNIQQSALVLISPLHSVLGSNFHKSVRNFFKRVWGALLCSNRQGRLREALIGYPEVSPFFFHSMVKETR